MQIKNLENAYGTKTIAVNIELIPQFSRIEKWEKQLSSLDEVAFKSQDRKKSWLFLFQFGLYYKLLYVCGL